MLKWLIYVSNGWCSVFNEPQLPFVTHPQSFSPGNPCLPPPRVCLTCPFTEMSSGFRVKVHLHCAVCLLKFSMYSKVMTHNRGDMCYDVIHVQTPPASFSLPPKATQSGACAAHTAWLTAVPLKERFRSSGEDSCHLEVFAHCCADRSSYRNSGTLSHGLECVWEKQLPGAFANLSHCHVKLLSGVAKRTW